MAKPVKRKVAGGRVTPPKGAVPKTTTSASSSSSSSTSSSSSAKSKGPAESSRYTAPIPREMKISPWWVPALMFTLLGLGVIIIICNYIGLVPGFIPGLPDDTSNTYLLIGLGLILGGIITATNYH
jgi:hypothetical protein